MLRKSIILSSIAYLLAMDGASKVNAAALYDLVSSDVVVYSKLNFEKQVSKSRDKGISIVHYYKTEE